MPGLPLLAQIRSWQGAGRWQDGPLPDLAKAVAGSILGFGRPMVSWWLPLPLAGRAQIMKTGGGLGAWVLECQATALGGGLDGLLSGEQRGSGVGCLSWLCGWRRECWRLVLARSLPATVAEHKSQSRGQDPVGRVGHLSHVR